VKPDSYLRAAEQAWLLIRPGFVSRRIPLLKKLRKKWDYENGELRKRAETCADGDYLQALAGLHIRHTEELARQEFRLCWKIWKDRGRAESPAFFQAVWDHCLDPIFTDRGHVIPGILRRVSRKQSSELETARAVNCFEEQLANLGKEFELGIEACDSQFLLPSKLGKNEAARGKPGPRTKRSPKFIKKARFLWRKAMRGQRRVSREELAEIARALDGELFHPPAKYLEKTAAKKLDDYNSEHWKTRVRTWQALVSLKSPKFDRDVRKMLSRCAHARPD